MKVADYLDTRGKKIISIDSRRSVEDAIRLMSSNRISAVIVNENDLTVGIFTERDTVKCYIASKGKSFRDIPLKDAMTTNLIVAELEDDVNDVMSIMVEKNIRHLPVVARGKVIGMLSIRDIIQTQVSKLKYEVDHLRDYITNI